MKNIYVECDCHSPEHVFRFVLDDDPDFPCVYCHVFLSNDVWYKRIFKAIKYVFGYKSKYGHFDEFLIRKEEECDKIIDILNQLKNLNKNE